MNINEILTVLQEMRDRHVQRRFKSPTLINWADRIQTALTDGAGVVGHFPADPAGANPAMAERFERAAAKAVLAGFDPPDWAIAAVAREMAASGPDGNSYTTQYEGGRIMAQARERALTTPSLAAPAGDGEPTPEAVACEVARSEGHEWAGLNEGTRILMTNSARNYCAARARLMPPPAPLAGQGGEADREYRVEVAMEAYNRAAADWTKRGPDNRDEPRHRYAMREAMAIASPTPPAASTQAHAANEWADMATNGIQWLRNVRDGISTPDEALAEMESNMQRIRALPAASTQGEGIVCASTLDDAAGDSSLSLDAARSLLRDAAAGIRTLAGKGSPDEMVNRFLGWKLPHDFCPDAGVSFTKPHIAHGWPTGTNLLSADQAKAMFLHCLAAPSPAAAGGENGNG